MEVDTKALMKKVEGEADSMTVWSDEKRKDFVTTFDSRVKASQFIMHSTARRLIDLAITKQYITDKHRRDIANNINSDQFLDGDRWHVHTAGGRQTSELNEIASDQAKTILRMLPPVKKAIEVIDPETSKMIAEKEKLESKGQKLYDQLAELSGDLDLDDLDQKTTIGELKTMVKKRETKRKTLVNRLNDIGEVLAELDKKICKNLYSGIPGLSDAVVKAINGCVEKATALGNLNRRVEEKVMFGDSDAAMEILHGFEKDEAKISDDIKDELSAAVKTLKLTGKTKK